MPEDKLTAKDISKEYGIGIVSVYELFKDPELPVQSYTRPKFVLREEWIKFLSKRHDSIKAQ